MHAETRTSGPSRGVSLSLAWLLSACGSGSSEEAPPEPEVIALPVAVDASVATGSIAPLWRDHYDLSYTHFDYASEAGFTTLAAELQPRSWRCSVGRWEVGFPPPTGGDSLDPAALRVVEREFYRGPDSLAGADDPANYDFGYLDRQLSDLRAIGAEPFLCFDYMPFTLAAEQNPSNSFNFNISEPGAPFATLSFSNGIRTAPPQTPTVYARVVRNTVRHVRGLFAGTTDFGVRDIEVGNEPDVFDASGQRSGVFWTGDRTQWRAMYEAIATAIDSDTSLSGSVRIGGGSFAFSPAEATPTFSADVLAGIGASGARIDFISFHSYADDIPFHLNRLITIQAIRNATGLTSATLVNGEWGRALGGLDPTYDGIEHGILRSKAMMLMQVFGVSEAHEAIYRNPGTSPGELGLTRTSPPGHKPVSLCYKALNAMNGATNAVQIDVPTGSFAIATLTPLDDRCVIALVVDEPAADTQTRVDLSVTNLPWGASNYRLQQTRVIDSSIDVELRIDRQSSGDSLQLSLPIRSGESGLYLYTLTRL